MSGKSVLIIGLDPRFVDFASMPPNVTPQWIMDGLNASLGQLQAGGHAAELLLVDDGPTAGGVLAARLGERRFDVAVIGAGIRVVPKNAQLLEVLVNTLHAEQPQLKVAFNTSPADSVDAALRFL